MLTGALNDNISMRRSHQGGSHESDVFYGTSENHTTSNTSATSDSRLNSTRARAQKVPEFESPPLHLQSALCADCDWLTNACDTAYICNLS